MSTTECRRALAAVLPSPKGAATASMKKRGTHHGVEEAAAKRLFYVKAARVRALGGQRVRRSTLKVGCQVEVWLRQRHTGEPQRTGVVLCGSERVLPSVRSVLSSHNATPRSVCCSLTRPSMPAARGSVKATVCEVVLCARVVRMTSAALFRHARSEAVVRAAGAGKMRVGRVESCRMSAIRGWYPLPVTPQRQCTLPGMPRSVR